MVSIQDKLKSMEILFDQEEFLVIDNGTGSVKAGFSGQDLPRLVLPTVVGSYVQPIDPAMQHTNMEEESKKMWSFGNKVWEKTAQEKEIVYPVKRGIIDTSDE